MGQALPNFVKTMHKYIHTYINTYIHTYIHTYTHAYIYTYILERAKLWEQLVHTLIILSHHSLV